MEDTDNYRPISLISITSKIFEYILDQLCNYMELNGLLNENQCGFKKSKSIKQVVHFLMEYIYVLSGE